MSGRIAAPNILALDLEMNQPSGRIIQIGAAVGNYRTGEILGSFEQLVNPGEPLSGEISALCGITPAALALAPAIREGAERLFAWRAAFSNLEMNPLTWGGSDAATLQRTLAAGGDATGMPDASWPFGRRWLDAKTIFVGWRMAHGQSPQAGLARALTKVGLAFVGRKHNATADAVNTLRIFHRLLQEIGPRVP